MDTVTLLSHTLLQYRPYTSKSGAKLFGWVMVASVHIQLSPPCRRILRGRVKRRRIIGSNIVGGRLLATSVRRDGIGGYPFVSVGLRI